MTTISVFSESGWDVSYLIRAAINSGDDALFTQLTTDLQPEVSVQVTMIGETLLRMSYGDKPTTTVLDAAAATLLPHVRHFMRSRDIERDHVVELIRTGLRLREAPRWASRAQTMMFFLGFFAPIDDAAFLDFRLQYEPLWTKAIEEHVR